MAKGAVVAAVLALCVASTALENKLARKPPLGYNTWNAFGININEGLVRELTDLMVNLGLREAGYNYMVVDDGWSELERDSEGRLMADRARFPSGMAALADYVHSKGLKFGIYADAGGFTCGHFPGSRGYEELDAQTFADWGVDYLKYDNCWAKRDDPTIVRYCAMRDALNKTGRPIVYSMCEWGMEEPWDWAAQVGNSWRTTIDMHPTWSRTLEILDNSVGLARFGGPGGWNDLDLLEAGNGALLPSQQRAHFALWALLKSPLMISTDLRALQPDSVALGLFKSRALLALSQDELGVPGELIWKAGCKEIYAAPLADGSRGVVLLNRHSIFHWQAPEEYPHTNITVRWEQLGLERGSTALVQDLLREQDLGEFVNSYTASVGVHDVAVLRVTPTESSEELMSWRPWQGQPIYAAFAKEEAEGGQGLVASVAGALGQLVALGTAWALS